MSADRRFSQENAALRMNGRSGEAAPQRIDGRPRSALGRKQSRLLAIFGTTLCMLTDTFIFRRSFADSIFPSGLNSAETGSRQK